MTHLGTLCFTKYGPRPEICVSGGDSGGDSEGGGETEQAVGSLKEIGSG